MLVILFHPCIFTDAKGKCVMKAYPLLGLFSIIFITLLSNTSPFQPSGRAVESAAGVNWLTWEEADKRSGSEKRKFMVDLYTDWCGWCKKMDAATYEKGYISEFINDNYYPVKFNAEMKEDVVFKGKTYSFVSSGQRGYHALAAEITKGRLGYPTVVFLDENMEVIQAISGFRGPDEFERILQYFAQDYHKKMSWEKFQQSYGQSVPAIDKD